MDLSAASLNPLTPRSLSTGGGWHCQTNALRMSGMWWFCFSLLNTILIFTTGFEADCDAPHCRWHTENAKDAFICLSGRYTTWYHSLKTNMVIWKVSTQPILLHWILKLLWLVLGWIKYVGDQLPLWATTASYLKLRFLTIYTQKLLVDQLRDCDQ